MGKMKKRRPRLSIMERDLLESHRIYSDYLDGSELLTFVHDEIYYWVLLIQHVNTPLTVPCLKLSLYNGILAAAPWEWMKGSFQATRP